MKKIYMFSLFAPLVTFFAVSCEKEIANDATEKQTKDSERHLTTITCSFPALTDQNGTKVSLGTDGSTGWEEGDKIVIYGQRNHSDSDDHPELDRVVHTLTASEIIDPTTAVFTVDISGLTPDPAGNHPYNAVYPYQDDDDYLPFYSKWGASGRARFKSTNNLLLAGWVDGGTMTLKNVCCAITFTVSGEYDEYFFSGYNGTETVGYGQYLVEFNNSENKPVSEQYYKKPNEEWGCKEPLTEISGSVKGDGTTLNYIFIPNEVNLADGFTITLANKGKKIKTISSKAALSLSHDHMINLGLLPSSKMKDVTVFSAAEMASAVDMSENESANCYVVSAADASNVSKLFKFRAVKGNSYVNGSSAGESVGAAYVASVLWETWNSTSSGVTTTSVINSVDYYDGFIYFKMPASLHAGNALIAVKDDKGTILWSWHIWVPGTAINDIDEGFAAAGKKIMDRNLGALYVAATGGTPDYNTHGLYYQWGRKDPFYSDRIKGAPSGALSTTNVADVGTSTDNTISHPTVFYHYTGKNWNSSQIATLWENSGKTEYDPCPVGYRVPIYNTSYKLWEKTDTDWTFDTVNMYAKHNDYASVFPMPGYLNDASGLWPSDSNGRTIIWSATDNASYKGKAAFFYLNQSSKYNQDLQYKTLGGSVRCVAE